MRGMTMARTIATVLVMLVAAFLIFAAMVGRDFEAGLTSVKSLTEG